MKKTKLKMTKPRYLGMSILDISKTLTYRFWYYYIRVKYGDRAKLCYTDTDSFVIHIITEDFFEDISGDAERWFDTSNYVALSINDNKRIQTFDKAAIFPQETPTVKVCGNEMLSVLKAKETLTY